MPKGSSWRKNPIPTVLWEREGPSFEPLCTESEVRRGGRMAGWRDDRSISVRACWGSTHPIPSPNPNQACRGYQVHGGGGPGEHVCRCSGHSNGGPLLPNLEMVDRLRIPATLRPGPYVLQWRCGRGHRTHLTLITSPRETRTRIPARWDCEESDQVWASCADVSVSAPSRLSSAASVEQA